MNILKLLHAHKATCVQAIVLTLALSTSWADTLLNESVSSTPIQVTANSSRLTGYTVVNRDATNPIFIHLYNALAANVTVGTTVQSYVVPVPAGGAAVRMLNNTTEFTFPKGLTMAITTSPLSTDATAPGTAAVVLVSYGVNP